MSRRLVNETMKKVLHESPILSLFPIYFPESKLTTCFKPSSSGESSLRDNDVWYTRMKNRRENKFLNLKGPLQHLKDDWDEDLQDKDDEGNLEGWNLPINFKF
ncbi:hypothetical protein AgCh_013525 [Apium graveolens]